MLQWSWPNRTQQVMFNHNMANKHLQLKPSCSFKQSDRIITCKAPAALRQRQLLVLWISCEDCVTKHSDWLCTDVRLHSLNIENWTIAAYSGAVAHDELSVATNSRFVHRWTSLCTFSCQLKFTSHPDFACASNDRSDINNCVLTSLEACTHTQLWYQYAHHCQLVTHSL